MTSPLYLVCAVQSREFTIMVARFWRCTASDWQCSGTEIVHCVDCLDHVQRGSYVLGQRFGACFVMIFALQRGEGEKREGVQFSKQIVQNLSYQNIQHR